MNSTMTMKPNNRALPVLIAALLIAAACVVVTNMVQQGIHAPMRHGEAAYSLPGMFDETGRCNRGPSVEMYSEQMGTWMYLCFEDGNKVNIWVLMDKISKSTREVTAIPARHISKPIKYLRSVLGRGYELKQTFGQIPDWFIRLVQ